MSLSNSTTILLNTTTVEKGLKAVRPHIIEAVRDIYVQLDGGEVLEGVHSFLTLPTDMRARRGIALPAALPRLGVFGCKWISSSPMNTELPRASGVIVLCDADSGRPISIMPASHISTMRTALSALLPVQLLGIDVINSLGIWGAGRLAYAVVVLLIDEGLLGPESTIHVYDIDVRRAEAYAMSVQNVAGPEVKVVKDPLESGPYEVALFATSSQTPYIVSAATEIAKGLILHLSLRDIHPSQMGTCENWTDSIEQAITEGTSLGRAVQAGFVHQEEIKEIGGVIVSRQRERTRGSGMTDVPICFSPFGLGALDLAVAHLILGWAVAEGECIEIESFESGDRLGTV